MKGSFSKFCLLPISFLTFMPAYAAVPVNLMQQPFSMLHSISSNHSNISMIETSRSLDAKKTLHVRIKETYSGYPVWGADGVIHTPNGGVNNAALVSTKASYMNGRFYQNLKGDLDNSPAMIFKQSQAQAALNWSVLDYSHKIGANIKVQDKKSELIVYVDNGNKAHWAYKISFLLPSLKRGTPPARPVYILDALSFQAYLKWNDIQTIQNIDVQGGGFGGNPKIGKLVYDGLWGNLPILAITRNNIVNLCQLRNADVTVKNQQTGHVINYKCLITNPSHNNVYWDGSLDETEGAFSPGNDALFGGDMVKRMYQDWYHVPVLTNPDGTPMMLRMFVHDQNEGDNAHWDGEQNIMVFGDGQDYFYPLTSLGITGHEVSHGFTQQHSNLAYEGRSGGMNESFSDMAAQAVEVYVYGPGQNTWKIGAEICKKPDMALRYMDTPSRDCGGYTPGNYCSIDNANQFYNGMDPHYSSGVYNRFFYLLSTTKGWSVKMAFDVMVQANSYYWTPTSTFNSGACGVLLAATDLKLDLKAIETAFDKVKVDYTDGSTCTVS